MFSHTGPHSLFSSATLPASPSDLSPCSLSHFVLLFVLPLNSLLTSGTCHLLLKVRATLRPHFPFQLAHCFLCIISVCLHVSFVSYRYYLVLGTALSNLGTQPWLGNRYYYKKKWYCLIICQPNLYSDYCLSVPVYLVERKWSCLKLWPLAGNSMARTERKQSSAREASQSPPPATYNYSIPEYVGIF